VKAIAHEDTQAKEVRTPSALYHLSPFIGQVASFHPGPQAFLVGMPESQATIDPHFHDIDQFQIVIGGDGRLGHETATPVTFHYADAYTPYGPIVANDRGIEFFTLRLACSTGFFPMPASRHLMPGKPGRNVSGAFQIGSAPPATGKQLTEDFFDEPDGLKISGFRLGAKTRLTAPSEIGGGQYYVVCNGCVVYQGRSYKPFSLLLIDAADTPPELDSGDTGAELLLLQFPRPSQRLGSDPAALASRQHTYKPPPGMAV
jgi:hypothetical protein